MDQLRTKKLVHVYIYIYLILSMRYMDTNNIHISYQSAVLRVQDKQFFFLPIICKNIRTITGWGGSQQSQQMSL